MRGVTTSSAPIIGSTVRFQLTRLMRGVTLRNFQPCDIHVFQLTRLMRGVTVCYTAVNVKRQFQLTRLMRGVTRKVLPLHVLPEISTHTPHARRDCFACSKSPEEHHFNSHASCEA